MDRRRGAGRNCSEVVGAVKPILFASTETSFATNGIGILGDCISGIAIEERNGMYEIEMEYPIFGIHYKDIVLRSLIAAKPNPTTAPQPFRVYDISAPMSGVVTVYARHICYDLAGIPIDPFTASGVVLALQRIKQNAAIDCPFEFWTDKSTAGNMTVSVPSAAWSLMGGSEGSILDVYGGEYEFDRYTVKLHNQRGQDRGVTIRYGKNLTDLNQERNCEAMYTGVYPYWADMDGNLMTLPEKTVHAKGTYDFEKIMPLDLSAEWQERPTAAQLRARAESFVKDNNIGVPKVRLKISFVQLEQTEEYKNMALLERVSLCDTVSVEFPDMGVSANAKAIRTVYNFIDERYESVELGDARTNLADVIVAQGQQIDKVSSSSYLQQAVDRATNWIVNGKGYMVAVKDEQGKWREMCSLDDPDITQAVNVWRWNNGGFGHSKNGYNGPYETAITQDGRIVADFITAGILIGNIIKAGIISDGKGKNFWNMETGEFSLSSATTVGGSTVTSIANNAVNNYDSSLGQQAIFNKLTNNGQTQGIYLSDGKVYVNADYIKAGTLDANNVVLSGKFRVGGADYTDGYIGRVYGNSGESATVGVGLTNTGGSLGGNRVMVTNSGASLSAGGKSVFVPANGTPGASGGFNVDGDLTVSGKISGTLSSSNGEIASLDATNIYLAGKLRPNNGQNALYCDWRRVQDSDGNWQWALCGFTSPQG